jgi:hypothetical protein
MFMETGMTYGMVITKQLIKEVNSLITDKALVLGRDERVPRLAREAREDIIILRVQLNVVLVQIFKELLSSQNLGNLDQLVRVAVAMEEGLLAEDHGSKHGTQ